MTAPWPARGRMFPAWDSPGGWRWSGQTSSPRGAPRWWSATRPGCRRGPAPPWSTPSTTPTAACCGASWRAWRTTWSPAERVGSSSPTWPSTWACAAGRTSWDGSLRPAWRCWTAGMSAPFTPRRRTGTTRSTPPGRRSSRRCGASARAPENKRPPGLTRTGAGRGRASAAVGGSALPHPRPRTHAGAGHAGSPLIPPALAFVQLLALFRGQDLVDLVLGAGVHAGQFGHDGSGLVGQGADVGFIVGGGVGQGLQVAAGFSQFLELGAEGGLLGVAQVEDLVLLGFGQIEAPQLAVAESAESAETAIAAVPHGPHATAGRRAVHGVGMGCEGHGHGDAGGGQQRGGGVEGRQTCFHDGLLAVGWTGGDPFAVLLQPVCASAA